MGIQGDEGKGGGKRKKEEKIYEFPLFMRILFLTRNMKILKRNKKTNMKKEY